MFYQSYLSFQIFPADVCVDILIERLKSSRYVGDILPSDLQSWLIVLPKKGSLVETFEQLRIFIKVQKCHHS